MSTINLDRDEARALLALIEAAQDRANDGDVDEYPGDPSWSVDELGHWDNIGLSLEAARLKLEAL